MPTSFRVARLPFGFLGKMTTRMHSCVWMSVNKWNRLKMLKLLFSNLMSGKVGDVFILIWRISDLLQSHIWFDKGSIMLTFFHEVMQPDSNGVIAVRKHWCPTKSHLIDPANKDRCRVSPRRGKENNLQTLVGQVFGPRPLSPSLMIPLGNDARKVTREDLRFHGGELTHV